MATVQVPLILIPRYTTYLGTMVYPSLAIDVSAFERVRLTGWRGPLVGTGTTFTMQLQDSMDRVTWASLVAPIDPGSGGLGTEIGANLTRPWLRVLADVAGANAGATCYLDGFLFRRER